MAICYQRVGVSKGGEQGRTRNGSVFGRLRRGGRVRGIGRAACGARKRWESMYRWRFRGSRALLLESEVEGSVGKSSWRCDGHFFFHVGVENAARSRGWTARISSEGPAAELDSVSRALKRQ